MLEKKLLLLFPSTYFCESGFSTLLHVKTKNRNRPDFTVEDELRYALDRTQPIIHNPVENVTQGQKSHQSLSRCLLCIKFDVLS